MKNVLNQWMRDNLILPAWSNGPPAKGSYKYLSAKKFYSNLQGLHSSDGTVDLFLVGLFHEFGLMKFEPAFLWWDG